MTNSLDLTFVAICLLGVTASAYDIKTRRVPNVVTFGAAIVAFVFHAVQSGLPGLGGSVGGWLAGAVLFFPWFALGGMGAGDVKLLAAFGAWLGPADAFWAAVYASLAGAVLALVVTLTKGYTQQAFSNLWTLLGYWRVVGPRPLPELTLSQGKGPRLAYAIPITVGGLLALWLR